MSRPDVAHEVDVIVMVVQADATRRHLVRHALDVMDLDDASKVKVVLNRKHFPIPGFLYDWV